MDTASRLALWCGRTAAVIAALAMLTAGAQAASFEVLHVFGGKHGAGPTGGLAFDGAQNLYGATVNSGNGTFGSLFKLEATSGYTRIDYLHYFRTVDDGRGPSGPLAVTPEGTVFGTAGGGAFNAGVVYGFDETTGFWKLFDFPSGKQDSFPMGLSRGPDGTLYGVTRVGDLRGTLFAVDPTSGQLTTLHRFRSDEGGATWGTVTVSNGMLYGVTQTRVYAFDLASGSMTFYAPLVVTLFHSPPVVGADGALWGTFYYSSDNGLGGVYRLDAAGQFEVVHAFDGSDGQRPEAPLVSGKDGMLYGATAYGGICNGCGTVFRVDPVSREIETLHMFAPDDRHGITPWASLAVDEVGRVYGMTLYTYFDARNYAVGAGTVYRISP
jgi:uncharacterized repeat protein (TIGR03803 family)